MSDIKVTIDKASGEYQTFRQWTISEEEEIDKEFEIRKEDIEGLTVEDGVARKK